MDTIPQDIWPVIGSFMDERSRRQMRLASTKWFNIVKYNYFKIHGAKSEDIPAITEQLSKYSWPIKLSLINAKIHRALDLIDYLPKLTNLTRIKTTCACTDFDGLTDEKWMQLSTLTNIEVWEVWKGIVPPQLYGKFPNLTRYWVADGQESVLVPVLKQMSNLQELCFFPRLTTWPFVHLPHPEKLTSFDVTLSQRKKHDRESWRLLTNLKQLTFSSDDYDRELDYLPSLEKLSISCADLPSLALNTNLTELQIDCTNYPLANLETIKNLKKIKTLFIWMVPSVPLAFLPHLPTLRKLALADRYLATDGFDLRDITQLTYLESLQIDNFVGGKFLDLFSNLTSLSINTWIDNVHVRTIKKLTNLKELSLDIAANVLDEEAVVDVSGFVNLEKMAWAGIAATGFQYLTNLASLQLETDTAPEDAENINHNYFFSLTKLTQLHAGSLQPNESFWRNLIQLTNIRELTLRYIDTNERVLGLSTLRNITFLNVLDTLDDNSFDGRNFTVLTSLRSLWYRGEGLVSNLLEKMPNLLAVNN
jgi:hypothetical protein